MVLFGLENRFVKPTFNHNKKLGSAGLLKKSRRNA